jgi:hypothetical protein
MLSLYLFLYLCEPYSIRPMARRRLSQTQIAFIIILWLVLVAYILLYAKITFYTIISILISGAIVFIPVYKNLKK